MGLGSGQTGVEFLHRNILRKIFKELLLNKHLAKKAVVYVKLFYTG